MFPRVPSNEDNIKLTHDVSINVIKTAIKQLDSIKAPGPDGLQGYLFGNYWDYVGPSVIKVVKDYFISGSADTRLNRAFIALIPKIANPITIKETYNFV